MMEEVFDLQKQLVDVTDLIHTVRPVYHVGESFPPIF